MHLQDGIQGLDQAILALPDNALVKSVSRPDLLRGAVQIWTAAGRDRRRLTTCYRHYDLLMPPREWNWVETKFWQEMMIRRYIDGTYLREYAGHVDLVQGTNETTSTSTWNDPADAAYHIRAEAAMVSVWNDKFRGRTVQSVDGGEGFIPANCKMTLLSCPVGNDIPVEILRLSRETDSPVDYHNYSKCKDGVRDPGDWRWHSGRWWFIEQEHGIPVQWVFGECGPYLDTDRGWRHPNVLGGDIEKLVAAMGAVYASIAATAAFLEDRILGQGAWFSSGSAASWPHYQYSASDIIAVANGIRPLWKKKESPMSIYVQSNTPENLNAAIQAMQREGFVETRRGTTEWAELEVAPPPVPPFYTRLLVGAFLRVIRPTGVMVYLNSALTQPWSRGVVVQGNTSMAVALLYDPEKDLKPPVGVLCVLKPGISSFFPNGLWIAAIGNDGRPSVESV